MKILSIFLLALFTLSTLKAQDVNPSLQAFENLVDDTWKGEGTWENGSHFVQHIMFERGLSGKIIKVKTYGNVSRGGSEFGLRNEGVRAWSEEASAVKFWEFDIFGGITEGIVDTDGNDMYYHYSYDAGQGPTEITDAWLYRDKDTYQYIIGVYQNGEWKQKYLSTTMKRSK
jgi:hypothetical protein